MAFLSKMEMSEQPHHRTRLLQDFLVPHLDNGTFGEKLCWVDRTRGVFRILWMHQSSSRFRSEDSEVYKQWAIVKRLWNPDNRKAHTMAKQRLRAALLKLKHVRCIRRNNLYREYQIEKSPDELYGTHPPLDNFDASWMQQPKSEANSYSDESEQSTHSSDGLDGSWNNQHNSEGNNYSDESEQSTHSSGTLNAPWTQQPNSQASNHSDESEQSMEHYDEYIESDEFIDQFLRSNLIFR